MALTYNQKISTFKEKMVYSKAITTLLILVLVSGCNSPKTKKELTPAREGARSELSGSFSVSGAFALYPLISRLADEFIWFRKACRLHLPDPAEYIRFH
jgi:ABC-type phosphate transport system substrate-binding protein